MVRSLGCSIINMYSVGACAALGISYQDALSEDFDNDPFLNSALQRAICELYYRFGSFLAPLIIRIITGRHYLSEHYKNGERTSGTSETRDQRPQERTAESYWIIYRYGAVKFFVWGWSHFRQ